MKVRNYTKGYEEEDEEEWEEPEPEDNYYTVTIGYVGTVQVKGKNEKEVEDAIWEQHWKWDMEFLEPAILEIKEEGDAEWIQKYKKENLEDYVPAQEFYKSIYVKDDAAA